MRKFPPTPLEMIASLARNWPLIVQLTQREILMRYRGSALGWAWAVFNPLFMLAIYTVVFSAFFNGRWHGRPEDSRSDFALILFAGLIVHGLFAECIQRAPALVTSQVNLVKKVPFPLEIFPWVSLGTALFHTAISLVLLLLAQLVLSHQLPWTAVLLPLVVLPLVIGLMGLSWLLASAGVYVRDLGQVTIVFATAMQFVSAVFFPISALPPDYQRWMRLNPLATVIEQSREVLIFGQFPELSAWCINLVVGLVLAWAGFAAFQKARKGFADVL